MNDMTVRKDYIAELYRSNIQTDIRDMYILKVCCSKWREYNLRTTKRKSKIYEMPNQ